jgi:tRNA/tmRNA/rRNA uracil-C5-methylase (TrmA/RlmC/RlmD family)
VEEQLHRVAGIDRTVEVEEVPGAPDGLRWRTRANFAVDGAGRAGFRRHRSHDVEPVEHCPIVTTEVDGAGVGLRSWKGVRQVEVTAAPGVGPPVVAVESRHGWRLPTAMSGVGLVVDGRTVQLPDTSSFTVDGRDFNVSAGVFWQVHPGAAAVLTGRVLEALEPREGETAVDLYAGAGLFTVALGHAVGPGGRVVAVERNGRACADLVRNAAGLDHVACVRAPVDPDTVARHVVGADLVVLDPARRGAGRPVMQGLASLDPAPRRLAYVACDPASFSRDLRVVLDAGWSLADLYAFDMFPMTEHVELVAVIDPPPHTAGA